MTHRPTALKVRSSALPTVSVVPSYPRLFNRGDSHRAGSITPCERAAELAQDYQLAEQQGVLVNFRKWRFGEGLLWLGFVALAVIAFEDRGVDNAVALTGLFALAAIGVRATRSVEVASPSDADDK